MLLSLWMNFWRYNSSRPLLSRSGCISKISGDAEVYGDAVLVPFYRGAVVFKLFLDNNLETLEFSSPFIEERLYLKDEN